MQDAASPHYRLGGEPPTVMGRATNSERNLAVLSLRSVTLGEMLYIVGNESHVLRD